MRRAPSSPVQQQARRRGATPAIRVPPTFETEFPGATAAATECFSNLVRAAEIGLGHVSRHLWSHYRLSPAGSLVLAVVEGEGAPLTPTEISERLLVTTGSMTSLLDTLERRGLVRRSPHPDDRRRVLVDITDEARRLADRFLPEVHAWQHRVMSVLSGSEQATLLRLLAKVQAGLAEADPPTPDGAVRRRVRQGGGDAARPAPTETIPS